MPAAHPQPAPVRLLRPRLPGHDRFEIEGLRALAAGRPRQLIEAVEASGRRDLVADLLRADAQVRQLSIDVPALQELLARVQDEEPGPADGADAGAANLRLRVWAHAALAERLAVDGEVTGLVVARQGLEELERAELPVLPPLALRYGRARLRRVAAASWLMVPAPEGLDAHRVLRDEAVAELLSCGLTDEVRATQGVAAGLQATVLLEDIRENHDRLVDARSALGETNDSMWPSILDYFLGTSCFEVGDMLGALEAYKRVERATFHHRRIDVMPAYGKAFFRLVTAGAAPLTIDGIERALAEVRRHDPRVAQHWYAHVTHTLADMGSRAAAHFARLESELPAVATMGQTDRRVLQLRVAALGGETVSTEEALRTLEAVSGFGHGRRAARAAVRLSHDLALGGDADGARTVHQWGRDRLPERSRCTPWEKWWCRPIDESLALVARPPVRAGRGGHRSAVSTRRGEPPLEIRVLAPTVEVEVAGRPVAISDAQAKLLLALVVAYPAPLHVEQASDVLWPDEALAATRSRLNSLVHRLRRVLQPHGEAVSRSGDLLLLDDERCRVDLWWFQRALTGDAEQRRRALLSVRGNLGDAQFPYEEGFFDDRHRLSGEWVRHACRAHRGGEVAIADLEPALTSLKLTSADLAGDLR